MQNTRWHRERQAAETRCRKGGLLNPDLACAQQDELHDLPENMGFRRNAG